MLEGVWTVAVRGGGGGTLPHAPDGLDGSGSCLRRKQITQRVGQEAQTQNVRMTAAEQTAT